MVQPRCVRQHMVVRVQTRLSSTPRDRLTAAYKEGCSQAALARESKVNRHTMAAELGQRKIAKPPTGTSATDQADMARRYLADWSTIRIARAFCVDPSTVRRRLMRAGMTRRRRMGIRLPGTPPRDTSVIEAAIQPGGRCHDDPAGPSPASAIGETTRNPSILVANSIPPSSVTTVMPFPSIRLATRVRSMISASGTGNG
jgi:hypothetical protein